MQPTVKLQKAPAYRFIVFVEMLLCYILIYAGIQMVATLGTDIMESMKISQSGLSLFSAIGNPAMAIISVLAGAVTAKFGGKRVLVIGLVILGISGGLYLAGPKSFVLLTVIRIIQGLGTGMVSATVQALVAVWFPGNERGTAQGGLAAFYGASTSVVTVYAGFMAARNALWYETAGYMLLVCGFVLAVVVAFGYRDIEKSYGVNVIDEAIEGYVPVASESGNSTGRELPNTWPDTLRSPAFWLVGISLFFYGGSSFGIGFCLPLFLADSGYDAVSTASIMTYGSLSSIIFSLAGGVIADRVFHGRRTQVYAISFGGAVIATLAVLFAGGNVSVVTMSAIYFFVMGFATFAGGPAWVLPVEVVGPQMAQQNMGTCLLFSGMGSTIMLIIYGFMAETFGADASMMCLACCMALPCIIALILGKKYKL